MRIKTLGALVCGCLSAAVLAPSTASGQATESTAKGHSIAVVDVAKIFKESPSIKSQVEAVENELKTFDATLGQRREELQQAMEQLQTFKPGSSDYTTQEERVANMESRLRLDMARKRKELSDAEAKIYYENYQEITAAVKTVANYNKINIVLRNNSEEMDLEKGDSVLRGVMRNIVYHDPALDMTPLVMQVLAQRLAKR